jgi:hypothetical protein
MGGHCTKPFTLYQQHGNTTVAIFGIVIVITSNWLLWFVTDFDIFLLGFY